MLCHGASPKNYFLIHTSLLSLQCWIEARQPLTPLLCHSGLGLLSPPQGCCDVHTPGVYVPRAWGQLAIQGTTCVTLGCEPAFPGIGLKA